MPIYLVILSAPGKEARLVAFVDGISGDVVHAYDFPYDKATFVASPQTDLWMKRLGRLGDVAVNRQMSRYDVKVGGKRFFNLNGKMWSLFQVKNGEFAYYLGFGVGPSGPTGKPRISPSRAIALAQAERRKTVPKWPNPLEARSELGLFFDEKSNSTKWAWKVEEGSVFAGKFSESFTNYVDAEAGRALGQDDIQNSSFPYRSRGTRVGLATVRPVKLDIPALRTAEQRLKDLGWEGLRFGKIELKDGVRMSNGFETELVLGPGGEIRSFKARPPLANINAATALAKGQKLVLAQHPSLPEGRFTIDPERTGYRYVVYRQRAFGYDYLNSDPAMVEYGANGAVAVFALRPASKRPAGLPSKILSPLDLERIAYRLAEPHVSKSTATTRYYASVKASNKIGWWVDERGTPILCRMVEVWFMRDIKNWAVQGGGSSYPFDVSTGRCLRKFPS